jgi:hypothetical protein
LITDNLDGVMAGEEPRGVELDGPVGQEWFW